MEKGQEGRERNSDPEIQLLRASKDSKLTAFTSAESNQMWTYG